MGNKGGGGIEMLLWPAMVSLVQVQATPPPELSADRPIVTREEYPSSALRMGQTGIVTVKLQIDATGKPVSCVVTETSRSKALDEASCSVYMRKARFQPARNALGVAIESSYRTVIVWALGDDRPSSSFDAPLTVASIPSDYVRPAKAMLQFDHDGKAVACDIRTSSGSSAADKAICRFFENQFLAKLAPVSGSSEPALAIRFVTASLTIGH